MNFQLPYKIKQTRYLCVTLDYTSCLYRTHLTLNTKNSNIEHLEKNDLLPNNVSQGYDWVHSTADGHVGIRTTDRYKIK